jgi:hypothetical protein
VWFLAQTGGNIELNTVLGLAILCLSALPALQWAKKRRAWFPAFEIGLLTYIAFYAIPLLNKHSELENYPSGIISYAALLVLLYLGAAIVGFNAVKSTMRAPTWASTTLLPPNASRHLIKGVALNTLYIYLYNFTHLIPDEFSSLLRALFFGIGTISTFVLARLWGQGRLSRPVITLTVLNLVAQFIMMFAQLYLIGGASLFTLVVISYSSAKRRIPWLALGLMIPLLAILHLGKPGMRIKYWGDAPARPTITQLPSYYAEWFSYSMQARQAAQNSGDTKASLSERASLLQMLCLSVDRVPTLRPHLGGESYIDLPAQIIPRILWPEKPSSLLANVRLALYFNLVSLEDALKVSIAFGVIAEAYVNFGVPGVIVLGLLFGAGFKRAALLSQNASQFSVLGILMILLTAWSFQIEFILATWLTSLFQAAVVCIGIPLVYRKFTSG